MGKGTITTVVGDGLYQVEIYKDWSKVSAHITEIEKAIAAKRSEHNKAVLARDAKEVEKDRAVVDMNDAISAYEAETNPPQIKEKWELVKATAKTCNQLAMEIVDLKSVELRLDLEVVALLTEWNSIDRRDKTDPTVSMYCADYTDDLGVSSVVGTIETPGRDPQIRPAFTNRAAYVAATDGDINPSNNLTSAGVFWNWAMRPGYGKWKPLHRVGTITDRTLDTCTVVLDSCTYDGLSINQGATLTNVEISYMQCDWRAFAIADRVIVEFVAHDWTQPRVIGFYNGPKKCPVWVENFDGLVYDMGENRKEAFDPDWLIAGHSGTPIYDTIPNSSVFRSAWGPYARDGNDVGLLLTDAWGTLGMKATMTKDGHKLFMCENFSTLQGGKIVFDGGSNFYQWAFLLPGDCQYIKLPDGTQSPDTVIPPSWTALQVTATFEQNDPEPIYKHFPGLSIVLQGSWDDDAYGGHWGYGGGYPYYGNDIGVREFNNFGAHMIVISPADLKTFYGWEIDDVDQYPPTLGWDSGTWRGRAIATFRNYPLPFPYPWGYGDGWVIGWTNLASAIDPFERDGYFVQYFYDNNTGSRSFNTVTLTCRIERSKFNMNQAATSIGIGVSQGLRCSIDRIEFFDD